MKTRENNCRFSVIVPTFNRADLIRETIASILNQSYQEFELIVVDDGSQDRTESVVGEFKGKMRYIRQANQGQCVARAHGVAVSRNEWIALCDSDDIWQVDYLKNVNALIQYQPETLVTFSNFQFFDGKVFWGNKFATAPVDYFEDFELLDRRDFLFLKSPMVEKLIRFQPVFTTATTFLKEHLAQVGGYNEMFAREYSEDLEVTLRLVSRGRIGVLTEPLVAIRKHSDNFSGSFPKVLRGEANILAYAAENHGYSDTLSRRIYQESRRRFVDAGRAFFDYRDYGSAVECFRKGGIGQWKAKDFVKFIFARTRVLDWFSKNG